MNNSSGCPRRRLVLAHIVLLNIAFVTFLAGGKANAGFIVHSALRASADAPAVTTHFHQIEKMPLTFSPFTLVPPIDDSRNLDLYVAENMPFGSPVNEVMLKSMGRYLRLDSMMGRNGERIGVLSKMMPPTLKTDLNPALLVQDSVGQNGLSPSTRRAGIALVALPDPSSVAMLGISGATWFGLVWRRRSSS
jgi:hypothetical protein